MVLSDGILTARELLSRRLDADLIVLSACQTGLPHILRGDELVGLMQSFLLAGARALLVSLWPIDDAATATFMRTLYDSRKAGADTPEAMTRAMAQVRSQPQLSHPYYWGAFIFVGDW